MFEKGEGGGATGLFDEKKSKLTYAITNVVNKKWEKGYTTILFEGEDNLIFKLLRWIYGI